MPKDRATTGTTATPPVGESPQRTSLKMVVDGFKEALVEGFREVLSHVGNKDAEKEDPLQAALRERARIDSISGIPKPFLLSNPQVLKDPWMWILYISKCKLAKSHFASEFGTKGIVVTAFESALEEFYPQISIPEKRELVDAFIQCGMITLNHPATAGVDDLIGTLEPSVIRAGRKLSMMDATVVSRFAGQRAGAAFLSSRLSLDPANFPVGAGESLRSAVRVAHSGGQGESGKKPRTEAVSDKSGPRKCHKCDLDVPANVLFSDHRKVCTKQKRV